MDLFLRLAVATALTFVFATSHAQDFDGPQKISCSTSDRSALLEATLKHDETKVRLTNLLIKNGADIHRPKLDRNNVNEFYFDSTFIHIKGKLANGKTIKFGAQPSVSESSQNTWTGNLEIDSKSTRLTCDLL